MQNLRFKSLRDAFAMLSTLLLLLASTTFASHIPSLPLSALGTEAVTHRRSLINDDVYGASFTPIRIQTIHTFPSTPSNDILSDVVIPAATFAFESTLKVSALSTLSIDANICKDYHPNLPGTPAVTLTDVDLAIYVFLVDDCGGGTLAFAGARRLDALTNYRPIVGCLFLCSPVFSTDDVERATGIVTHEIGHIAGFSSSLFFLWPDQDGGFQSGNPFTAVEVLTECVNGGSSMEYPISPDVLKKTTNVYGEIEYFLVSPKIKQTQQNHYGCYDDAVLPGAALENHPTGSSCYGSHWEELYSKGDLMSAYYDQHGLSGLSALDLAFFESTNWYERAKRRDVG